MFSCSHVPEYQLRGIYQNYWRTYLNWGLHVVRVDSVQSIGLGKKKLEVRERGIDGCITCCK